MPSAILHTQQEEESTGSLQMMDPSRPFPSLRSLDLDMADFWSHLVLQQPIESNLEDILEELEKIVPRLNPLNIFKDDDDDEDEASNDENKDSDLKKTEQSVASRMRMLHVFQDVVTLELQKDSDEPSSVIFEDPCLATEDILNLRNRLESALAKLHPRSSDPKSQDYERICESLSALGGVLSALATLATLAQNSPSSKPKAGEVTKSPPSSKAEWLEELSETLKSMTSKYFEDDIPVPDALASVSSFVLQLVAARQTKDQAPPSPSPLTQDSAIADRHLDGDDDDVSDDVIAKVQQGLVNLYGRRESPYYIVQLQQDIQKLLLHWSTNVLELPKLTKLGYLTGKAINTTTSSAGADASSDTVNQGAAASVDVEVQTETNADEPGMEVEEQTEKNATEPSHEANDSDSETTLGNSNRRKVGQEDTSDVVNQIWSNSKNRSEESAPRDPPAPRFHSPTKPSAAPTTSYSNLQPTPLHKVKPPPQHSAQKKPEPSAQRKKPSQELSSDEENDKHKPNAMDNKQMEPPQASNPKETKETSKPQAQNLKPPPVYPDQMQPAISLKPPPVYPSKKQPTPSPKPSKKRSLQLSSDEEDEEPKPKAAKPPTVESRRASDPTETRGVETNKSRVTHNQRARSQEPSTRKPVRKKQKKTTTEADILQAIQQGVATYGYGNWTMIKKKSGGILKNLTGSQIKQMASSMKNDDNNII